MRGKAPSGGASAGQAAAQKRAAGKTARRTAAGAAPPEGAAAGRTSAGKAAAKETSAGAVPVEEAPVRRAATEKGAVGAAPGRRAAVGETGGADEGGGRGGGKRAAVRSAGGTGGKGKGTTRNSGGTQDMAGRDTATDAGAAEAATQTGATTVGAKKTPGTATAAKTAVPKARIAAAEPGDLAVRPGEDPWTPEEVEEARSGLMAEVTRLRDEISSSEQSLAGLMRDSGDGAGDDDADTGTKNITREHELALAANAREMLTQSERALQRLDAGTYGLCENCGNPIGKARMQAFPRATLCVECKQKQERR
ncbi:TraR/DksA family transcriptional regulator [Streptomyces griseomycini]|uniref:TraR/DksA family transcriptional regulator n=1 Tax=Streptomyces griseomycini TaxID=66895 RepID=UPI0035CA6443